MRVLQNCWYGAGWAADFPIGAPLQRVIADTPFEVCVADGAARAQTRGRGVAAAVRHKLVWVWLGDADKAALDLIPDLSFFDAAPDTAAFFGDMRMEANYLLGVDNIMDLSHSDYLHPDTLGGGAITRAGGIVEREGRCIRVVWEARADRAFPIFDRQLPTPGMPADTTIEVLWYPASVIMLRTRVAPAGEKFENWFDVQATHIMTPISDMATHYQYGATRSYARENAELNAFTAAAVRAAFELEDKPIIEAQQQMMGTSDLFSLQPMLLRTDAGPVQVRRSLDRLIEAEATA